MDDLIDLRLPEDRTAAGVDLAAMACAWAYDRASGRKPPSWTLAQTLIARGAAGMLTASFANGARPAMANLVLWRWGTSPPHRVTVLDPAGRLPHDQASWRA